MAEKWDASPVKVVAEIVKPSMLRDDPTTQEVGKYSVQGLLKFGIKVNGVWRDFFGTDAPVAGEEIEIRRCFKLEDNGEEKYPKWVLESQYQKIVGSKKTFGGGGGAKPNYSLEQEAMRDGQKAAIMALSSGLVGKDGKMDFTLPNIRTVAAAFAADILAAGKKSEPQA